MFQYFVDDALSVVNDEIEQGFMQFVTYILGFFPDGDPAIFAVIDSWSFTPGTGTFNLLYFIDIEAVSLFVGLAVAIPFVVIAVDAVKGTISTVNSVLDKIPITIGK